MAKLMPTLEDSVVNMIDNFEQWGIRKKTDVDLGNWINKDADPEEEKRKIDGRIQAFHGKFEFLGEHKS